MLSAFAARSAAQVTVETPVPPASSPNPNPSPSPPKPNSKRKLSNQTPNSSRKRKKKREAETKKPRYFEDVLDESTDIIIVDSEDEEELLSMTVAGKRSYSPSAPVNDSSEEELDEILDVPIPPASFQPRLPQNLSTFSPEPDTNTFHLLPEELALLNLSVDCATLISLRPGSTMALVGVYSLSVLRGAVSIYGARLHSSTTPHRVFAPRSAPIPIIEVLNASSTLQIDLPARLQAVFVDDNVVIVLSALQTGVEGLGRICRIFEGVFSPPRLYQGYKAEYELVSTAKMVTEPSKDLQPLFLSPTWKKALDRTYESKDPIILVKGQKNAGKSTFARALLNRLSSRYRRIAYLECDLGQSEFTPGCMVALNVVENPVFGPPFTHPTIPNFAHYLGSTSPKQMPAQYISAVQSLLETYRVEVQTLVDDAGEDDRISDVVPLIVNTMGWTKGLGADLARRIEDLVQPTDIFELDSASSPPCQGANVHCLEPIAPSPLTSSYTAADHRSIASLSYFHAQFSQTVEDGVEQQTAVTWNTSLPLCAQRPYEVDWSVAFDKLVLCGAGSEDVVPSEVARVLNGAVVGLVEYEPGTLDYDMEEETHSEVPYAQGADLPSPSTSVCHGLAFIRSVSPTSSHMHVLTPLRPELISRCRVLVKGEMELPVWGMLDFTSTSNEEGEVAGTEKARVPYLRWDKSEGLGGEKRRVRRNLMRKAQR
ncbi:hypothetical protein C8F01DRAFT_712278 [Mycena amicta]|nr:hypothetical protein C8F01DRAFT_712278 [Mycena amicta]